MFGGRRIYMDTAAATPVDSAVRRAMLPYLGARFGNPSSIHAEGLIAKQALDSARAKVATHLGAHPEEIIFTSGGTEANNLAIRGVGGPALFSAIEHPSVLNAEPGATHMPVNKDGLINLEVLKASLKPETRLVSVMYASNEIGSIQPLRAVAKIIRSHRKFFKTVFPYFHTDACQATRFLDLNVLRLGVDLMTINSAKMYGPKGVGVLYARRGLALQPQIAGGGQEAGRRAGTENVAGAVGLATALDLAVRSREGEWKHLLPLRDRLIKGFLRLPGTKLQGGESERLPNNINISFEQVLAEQLVIELDAKGVAVSTGSACAVASHDDSYVIMALGQSAEEARQSVRFTLGRDATKRDVDYVLKVVPPILRRLRGVVK